MAMRIEVKVQTEKLIKEFEHLSKSNADKATARAINHTLAKARTEVSKKIRETYKFPADKVKSSMFIVKASNNNTSGQLQASTYTNPLGLFKPIEIRENVETKYLGSKKNGGFASKKISANKAKSVVKGVSVEIINGQRKVIPQAYLAFNKNAKGTVKARGQYGKRFEFDNKMRPHTLQSKSIYWAITGDKLNAIVSNRVSEDYNDRLRYEIQHLLGIK